MGLSESGVEPDGLIQVRFCLRDLAILQVGHANDVSGGRRPGCVPSHFLELGQTLCGLSLSESYLTLEKSGIQI